MKLTRTLLSGALVLVMAAGVRAATAPSPAASTDSSTKTADAPAAAPAVSIASGITNQDVQRAVDGGPDSLLQLQSKLSALLAADPKSKELHYWIGYTDYRLAPRLMKDRSASERYVKDGLQHLDQAIKLDPKFADAIALEAGLRGFSIMLEPARGPALGGEIEEELGRASGIAPRNPRVALLDGKNTYHKPKFVGGGFDKALAKLAKAQQLFAAERSGTPPAIDWGYDDAFAWAGQAAAKLKRFDVARGYYQKALELNPDNGWVKFVLMPELDQAAKGKS